MTLFAERRSKTIVLLLLTFLLSIAGLPLTAPEASAASFQWLGAPKQTVGVTKPPIAFYYSTDMTVPPDSFAMYVDGAKVAAVWDPSEEAFLYTPSADLAPGPHTVRMTIRYAGYEPVEKTWTFTVAKDAIQQFAAPSAEQTDGLSAVNDYRTLFGLPPVVLNDKLNAGASAHAAYLDQNKIKQTKESKESKESLHDQNPDKPGFFGKRPLERAAYFGYSSGVGEDAAYMKGTIAESVDALFDAPYHRSPFLNPYLKEVGIGKSGNYTVIEFGQEREAEPKPVVSPADGDRYVPTSFDGNEEPDPLRIHAGSEYPAGYPIMAEYFGSGIDQVKVLGADLTDNDTKKTVEFALNTPDTDKSLNAAVILIPRKPLRPDTSYHVMLSLQLTKKDGSRITEVKEWDFTTEPADGIGKKLLHQSPADYKKKFVSSSPVRRTAAFGLDDRHYTVDGFRFPMKLKPALLDGSSYLYIRDLAAALGAGVEWDADKRAAVYTKGKLKVTLYTMKNEIEVNGEPRQTDSPAKLIGEYTMVPVRLLSEVLGAKVSFNEATRTVTITY
ncbi:stalk domain-containing protein [Paenibacillus sp. GYB003]|uniref:stalk domain-containing protein n=1 Tax=Paenibacillus sp. GYB003 TaxID=2994392 RepID=UPI002F964681